MANFCKHEIDLDVAVCTDCRTPVQRPHAHPNGAWFPAKFDGHCAECKTPIAPGDLIARNLGGLGYVRHDCCCVHGE